jgi:hypothetical protein
VGIPFDALRPWNTSHAVAANRPREKINETSAFQHMAKRVRTDTTQSLCRTDTTLSLCRTDNTVAAARR